jgi:tetratricopeptide (TPR) repeat protein
VIRARRPRPADGALCVAGRALALTGILAALLSVVLATDPARAGAPKDPAIRVLVVKTESEAREAVAQFNAGMGFDRIVRERSIGPERDRGGYLGRVDPATLSAAARAAVARTGSGRLTSVFPTEAGFGVIQVLTDQEEQEVETQLRKEPEALALLQEGTDFGKRGDLDRALQLLQRAVELNPRLVDGHFNLAVGLWKVGRWDAAMAAMREVIRLDPNDFVAHLLLGGWLSDRGRPDEAVVDFERAAALDVNSLEAWRKLAQAYDAAGRARAAVGAYRRALGLLGRDDPVLLEAWLAAAMRAPNGPAAVEAARKLRGIRPGHEGFVMVGDALLLNGEAEAAVQEYRKALGLAPASVQAQVGLAAATARLGQTESATQHLLAAIRLDPANPAHYQTLSRLYEDMGRLDLAIVALRDGVAAASGAPRATQAALADRLASLYERAEMRREAEQEWRRAKALREP